MTTPESHEPQVYRAEPHYAYQVQLLIEIFNSGQLPEVNRIIVESRYGYVASLEYKDGSQRIIYGGDTGLNSASSQALAKDKGYSKFMLRSMGIQCPEGEEFLLPWWAEALQHNA